MIEKGGATRSRLLCYERTGLQGSRCRAAFRSICKPSPAQRPSSGSVQDSEAACFFFSSSSSTRRRILPTVVLGNSSRNSTYLGTL